MLVDHNIFTLTLIRAGVFLFGYLGLGCFIYFLAALFIAGVDGISHPFSIAVEAIGAIEILWYFVWYLPYRTYLGRPGLPMNPITQDERMSLFHKLVHFTPDHHLFIRKWFNNAHLDEIYQDEMKDWLLWAFWNRQGAPGDDDDELNEMIGVMEEKVGYVFRKGRAGASAVRSSLDPVSMRHASLFWYMGVAGADMLTTTWLLVRGFRFYRQPILSFFTNFPFRPLTLLSLRRSSAPEFSYFYRPHKSKTHRPLVFMHGIGMGLLPYLAFFEHLPSDVGILAIEFMPVSGRICPEAVPQRDFVTAMRKILAQQQLDNFVMMGHSYGTLMARSLLDDPIVSAKIHSVILCDPAAIMMHLPDLSYNIMRREPSNAPELEMKWFAAADPRTAHTVTRRLHWQDCVLWREQLVDKRTTVIIGERDCVISPLAAASYIYYGHLDWSRNDVEEWKKTPDTWTGRGELELFFLGDRDHGQSLMAPKELKRVAKVVDTYCRLDGDEPDMRQVEGTEKSASDNGNEYSQEEEAEKVEIGKAEMVEVGRAGISTNSGAV